GNNDLPPNSKNMNLMRLLILTGPLKPFPKGRKFNIIFFE
ncbi:MAG: hypothetical protein ACJA13_002705, partial [Paraglaciecola sp.]